LWKSGIFGNTMFSIDVQPGPITSNISAIVAAGTSLFFAANDGINGNELWSLTNPTVGPFQAQGLGTDSASPSFAVSPSAMRGGLRNFLPANHASSLWQIGFGGYEFAAPRLRDLNARWIAANRKQTLVAIMPGTIGLIPVERMNVNGILFFSPNAGING
jgi:hypothetical protein